MLGELVNKLFENEKSLTDEGKLNTFARRKNQLETCDLILKLTNEASDRQDEAHILDIIGKMLFSMQISKSEDEVFANFIKGFAEHLEWYVKETNPRKGELERRLKQYLHENRFFFFTRVGYLKSSICYLEDKRKH